MRGYVEHNSRACSLGGHSNRGPVDKMCPVYLELRRVRLARIMRSNRHLEKHGGTADGRLAALQLRYDQQSPFDGVNGVA
jgi:hypothetical protein